MAIISMFYGIIISMYYFDNRKHKLAHIHVKYQDKQAIFTIPDGKMLEDNYEILLSFENGEIKVFDMKPYIDKGFFKQLQDKTYFKTVKPHFDSIQWANG